MQVFLICMVVASIFVGVSRVREERELELPRHGTLSVAQSDMATEIASRCVTLALSSMRAGEDDDAARYIADAKLWSTTTANFIGVVAETATTKEERELLLPLLRPPEAEALKDY